MVTITVDNSYSSIAGLKSTDFNKLRKLLSYQQDPQAAYFRGGFNRPTYLLDKKGSFPTGLLKKVRSFLSSHLIQASLKDSRKTPVAARAISTDIPATPYPWQLKATQEALLVGRGGIVAATGTGKSLVIALIASRLNVKTLVVVPSLEIKKQLYSAITRFLGPDHKVQVENIDSKALETLKGFDCLIIDECHHVAAKTYQQLNKTAWKGIYYRFFLTATFFRNQQNEQLLFEGIAGEVIYELTYKEAVKEKIIVPVEAYYIDLEKKAVSGHTWASVYQELVVKNDIRNGIIAGILKQLDSCGVSTLCLVKEVNHGKNIAELSGSGFVHGQDEESRVLIKHFNDRESFTLIGTNGILGEGVDTKPAEYVIIAGLGKAKSAFMQQVGRAVRKYEGKESAKIIIFKDDSHKWTKSHFNAQKKILIDEYGVAPVRLGL